MHLLIVAATAGEIHALQQTFDLQDIYPDLARSQTASWKIDWLTTGIGMVNTALKIGYYLG
ncbi:MAG: hypothetical protein AAFR59_12500, partial [Bacteroidota bacterium]